jgi:hypothetical protein
MHVVDGGAGQQLLQILHAVDAAALQRGASSTVIGVGTLCDFRYGGAWRR